MWQQTSRNLLPYYSAAQNIAMPLHFEKLSKEETDRRVNKVAKILHLTEVLDRMPGQVSEGEKQRIAVARAIAPAVIPLEELDGQPSPGTPHAIGAIEDVAETMPAQWACAISLPLYGAHATAADRAWKSPAADLQQGPGRTGIQRRYVNETIRTAF